MSDNGQVFPRWVPGTDARAMLREVGDGLYVGGMIAVCERPSKTREWWGAIDCHGFREDGKREFRFGQLPRVIRFGFDDGDRVPEALLAAAEALYRAAQGPLLVSCAAGASRSASVAYALLRVVRGYSPEGALSRVKLLGSGPLPVTLASAEQWAATRLVQLLGVESP
jgi:protein-tyrosine phosphatase